MESGNLQGWQHGLNSDRDLAAIAQDMCLQVISRGQGSTLWGSIHHFWSVIGWGMLPKVLITRPFQPARHEQMATGNETRVHWKGKEARGWGTYSIRNNTASNKLPPVEGEDGFGVRGDCNFFVETEIRLLNKAAVWENNFLNQRQLKVLGFGTESIYSSDRIALGCVK